MGICGIFNNSPGGFNGIIAIIAAARVCGFTKTTAQLGVSQSVLIHQWWHGANAGYSGTGERHAIFSQQLRHATIHGRTTLS
jgi:hypothetical protein